MKRVAPPLQLMLALLSLALLLQGCPEPAQVIYACDTTADCDPGLECVQNECLDPATLCGDGIVQEIEACDPEDTSTDHCAYGAESCQRCTESCELERLPRIAPSCGDSKLQKEFEECDGGLDPAQLCDYGETSCQVCNTECKLTAGQVRLCGDGMVQSEGGEQCDEGPDPSQLCKYGEASCVVCSAECRLTVGQINLCGDNVIQEGEQCDEGLEPNQACDYGVRQCKVCSTECRLIDGEISRCGDGIVDAADGEECDLGDDPDTTCPYGETTCEVCNAQCQVVEGQTSYCGDLQVDPEKEACDQGSGAPQDCDYGETSCMVCNDTCDLVPGQISLCGDGVVDTLEGEECDPGANPILDCAYGESSCQVCDASCHLVPGNTSFCGDGILESSREACDAGQDPNPNCVYGATSCTVCDATCNQTQGITSLCGDSIVDSANESCDEGTSPVQECAYGEQSCDVCNTSCNTISGIVTGYCGDGVIQTAMEQCEGTNFGANSCESLTGFAYGSSLLSCDTTCLASTQDCFGISQVAATIDHTCALTSSGLVYCWGLNHEQELGPHIAGQAVIDTPRLISSLSDVVEISAGIRHNCALDSAGDVYCWGGNYVGQLGTGNQIPSALPVQVNLPSTATHIASGLEHTCATTTSGTTYCWGSNQWGAINQDTNTVQFSAVPVAALRTGYERIAAGQFSTCGYNSNGTSCWGAIAGYTWVTLDITGGDLLTKVSMGNDHACGLKQSGNMVCWGTNYAGRLGLGHHFNPPPGWAEFVIEPSPSISPAPMGGVIDIALGQDHSCALLNSGQVYCWGDNNSGNIGSSIPVGSNMHVFRPEPVTNATSATSIAAGDYHTCMIQDTGVLSCWGQNTTGKLTFVSLLDPLPTPTLTTGWP